VALHAGLGQPATGRRASPECVDHEVDGEIRPVSPDRRNPHRVGADAGDLDAVSNVDARIGAHGATQRPLDDRAAHCEVLQILITRPGRSGQLAPQVHVLGARSDQRGVYVGQVLLEFDPSPRDERVWL
jgi:hypothetical protein